ncbi:MAG TPA: hypothetical protein VIC27_10930 [Ktedonobacterales bacterium]|jgi:hypothetical protein
MTDAEFELELVEALNMLLEDERASVEMEVALASGATEYGERETLTAMGAQDIRFCEQLREEMEHAGLVVTPQINGVVFQVIGAERYDDRLRAFAHHQRLVAERARELQESNLEGTLRGALEGISVAHDRDTQWSERRASEFAATRTLEFGSALRSGIVVPENEPASLVAPEYDAAPAEPPADLPATAPSVELAEPGEPAEQRLEQAAEPVEPDQSAGASDQSSVEAAPPKPRTRATSRSSSTAKGAAKPTTSRAKAAPKTTSATKRSTMPRRAPDAGDD